MQLSSLNKQISPIKGPFLAVPGTPAAGGTDFVSASMGCRFSKGPGSYEGRHTTKRIIKNSASVEDPSKHIIRLATSNYSPSHSL